VIFSVSVEPFSSSCVCSSFSYLPSFITLDRESVDVIAALVYVYTCQNKRKKIVIIITNAEDR
jgi:hypothetical protein